MKRERRSPSPPLVPRKGTYESWRPSASQSPFSIPGLKFNSPLRNSRTQNILMSKTPYLRSDDEPRDIVTKNVTVAVRIMLFYHSIWAHKDIWQFVAEDLDWPTDPDWNVLKKVIICHGMARQAYLKEERRDLTKPAIFNSTVRVCHAAIDAFNNAWFAKETPRHRVSSGQVSNRRKEWHNMMKHNPGVILSADFEPDSKDGRPTPKRPNTPPLPVKEALSFQTPSLPAPSGKAKEKPRQLSPSRKRVASPDSMAPLSRKSPRLSDSTDVSSHRRDSNSGSFNSPIISRIPSAPTLADPGPLAPAAPFSNLSLTLPRELKDGVAAMRMYIKLLSEQVDKVAAIDHTNTPDLVLCEIVEMQMLCQTIQNRDQRISNILENRPY